MDKLQVKGIADLSGSISVAGSKNAALPIMASSLLTNTTLHLKNLPKLDDIETMKSLLNDFGIKFKENHSSTTIINKQILNSVADYNLVRKMRASILILGPLLSRFKRVKISLPGGCAIGTRPVDLHLFGLEKLGAKFIIEDGYIVGIVENNLSGAKINMPSISVGATENIMMAAVLAKGKTIINNAAREPEVQDLANCLIKMGAKIKGAGTPKISIEGINNLNEAKHEIISDRIVAGTYIIAAVMLNKLFTIKDFNPNHLIKPLKILRTMGANMQIGRNYVKIKPSKLIKGANIETQPYPGFPTDLQAQIMALMSLANGKSKIKETVFEKRFLHVPELNRLGAEIAIKRDTAFIKGNKKFKGAQVMASDLRASVSLILAGLCAEGTTIINRVYHLDRGYEKIEENLGKCGPNIIRVK